MAELTTTQPTAPAADDVHWDLEPLVDGAGPDGVDHMLDQADALAGDLAARRGAVANLDADGLVQFMATLARLQDRIERADSYAGLRFAADTRDAERGALVARVEERATAIRTRLLFFDLEWAALDNEVAEALLADPRLDACRHHLCVLRRFRPHLLSEPEERIAAEKDLTARSAWQRLFDEQDAAIEIELEGEVVGLERGLALLGHPDRDTRRRAAEAVTAGLATGLRTRAFILNTLLLEKATDDRLRRHGHWLSARNLANQASDASVEALVEAVRSRYDLPQRWNRAKAAMLGLDRLADYDRACSLADEDREISWPDATELVADAYRSFSPELADIVGRFLDEGWIDAPATPGKRTGAFCAYTVPDHHPYVLLNWTGRRRDAMTLAHELGHGVHAYLARPQGIYQMTTPLTMAETASVFGETLTIGRLLTGTTDPAERLDLLSGSIDDSIATVFRQVAMNQFEAAAHEARRSEGELAVERINDLWATTQADMFGDTMEVTPGYRTWWSYIPHVFVIPGYVYAYAFGKLLALAVYHRYEEDGTAFVPRYLQMLSAGGSRPPEELARLVGCDLTEPSFWQGGLDIIESQIDAAEGTRRERRGASDTRPGCFAPAQWLEGRIMDAWILDDSPGSYRWGQVDLVDPGPGEVRIEVRMSALNHMDLWVTRALPKPPLPHVPGCDVAGVVDAIGDGVTTLTVGDEVVVNPAVSPVEDIAALGDDSPMGDGFLIYGEHCWGGHATHAVAPARNVVRRPALRSWEETAAYPLAYLTAYRMLRRGRLQAGETVLVVGIGSGVSCAALALARHMGARVVATSRDEGKRAQALALGAEAAFDSTAARWPVQADVVIESVGPATWEQSVRSLRAGGRLVVCGGTSGPKVELTLPRVFFKQIEIIGSSMGSYREFTQLTALIDQGLPVQIDQVFDLADYPAALERLERSQQLGKIVLRHPA